MSRSAPFRLNRSGLLLALISAGFAGSAGAAAGRVDFTTAGVTVAGRDGQQRPLARGAELDNGDTVRTNEGRAQIRFTDGAYVSLQPNTEFGIADYRYEGKTDGSERSFFGLVRGAMRTVTGAVGRVNRAAYRVTTPTATVGIRGTGGVIQVLQDGSTLVIGTSGIWSLANPAGTVDVPAGTSALAPSEPNQPPRESSTQPTAGPAPIPPEQPVFVQGEQVGPDGLPQGLVPTTPLLSGPGYAAAVAFSSSGSPSVDPVSNGTAVFDLSGKLVSLTSGLNVYALGTGSHADFGTDGIVAWGRWIGDVSVPGDVLPVNLNQNKGVHYVIGMPTPVMPTTGSAIYSLLGSTSPTYLDGSTAPGQVTSGSLDVIFGVSPRIDLVNLGIAMPDRSYLLNGQTSSMSGSAFSMSSIGVKVDGLSCSTCNSSVQGFFSGANAERAGIGYHVGGTDPTGAPIPNLLGAAAFKKK